ncbi:MAG TPA: 5'-methylthioadenosine/adenosylhomocysteine nucleosidase [Saprospiraceae bacterium]|nr:5'-methylthioadenosine/adenosylhomocysteine nucleosidase [Saprospiraceae bacterium]
MIGIMGAMHEELDRIVSMIESVSEEKVGNKTVYLGLLNDQKVVVVFSGWGKVAAATTSTMLIERYKITSLIFTGVAGAISPSLSIGDIVIGTSFVQHDMDCAGVLGIKRFEIPLLSLTEIPSSFNLQKQSIQAAKKYVAEDLVSDVSKDELDQLGVSKPNVYTGLIASGDQFISSADKQQELLDALPKLLAVEMEGAAVAQVAYEYELDFIVIRIISDKADDDAVIDFPRFIEHVASHFTAGIIKRLV